MRTLNSWPTSPSAFQTATTATAKAESGVSAESVASAVLAATEVMTATTVAMEIRVLLDLLAEAPVQDQLDPLVAGDKLDRQVRAVPDPLGPQEWTAPQPILERRDQKDRQVLKVLRETQAQLVPIRR